jgi:hypothetical protein
MTNVTVSKLADFIELKERNLCQFKAVLSNMESEYGNILCYAGIYWLS